MDSTLPSFCLVFQIIDVKILICFRYKVNHCAKFLTLIVFNTEAHFHRTAKAENTAYQFFCSAKKNTKKKGYQLQDVQVTCYFGWYFGWLTYSGKHNFVVLSYFSALKSISMKLALSD